MGDPAVLSDRKRYRAVLDEYSFLKKLDYAWTAYQLEEATEQEVLAALLPPDPLERRNAVMEIRAGTGGEEAALSRVTFSGCIPATARRRAGRSS